MRTMKNSSSQPPVVAIGGGTGLANMLRGLKLYTSDLTAIVTMADDGGGSGVLRDDLGILPPGDVRNCMQALANTEPTMEKLWSYRFTEGRLSGQSMGNLFLAALCDLYGSFYEAVRKMSDVLAITGRVLPVTTENVRLKAEFADGTEVLGESKISGYKKESGSRIKRISVIPADPPALKESIEAIERAQLILIGPGSLYTSIIPNLLTDSVSEAISRSDALKVYVLNVATEAGETEGYAASDHVRAIFDHAGGQVFDYCLANSQRLSPAVARHCDALGVGQTVVDSTELAQMGVKTVMFPMLGSAECYAHHDSELLARRVMELFREESPTRVYG